MAPTERKPRALIVDDDDGMRGNMAHILQAGGFETTEVTSGAEALAHLETATFDVALLDIQMPGMDGLETLERIREKAPDVEVVMVTVLKEIPKVVEAMKLGAFDFLTKDFRTSELQLKAKQALEHRRTARQMAYLRDEVERQAPGEMVMGTGPAMREVSALVDKVAPLPATVLILGESGTGKELLARRIHRIWSKGDKRKPFVTVNLATMQDTLVESQLFGHEKGAFTGADQPQLGKFELADGGTLFLDEIAELRLKLQSKLLRAIQEREVERLGGKRPIPVDVRLIAATNVDLKQAVHAGRFREDLYYRINVIPIRVPPLRERIEDIPILARHFARKIARSYHKPPFEITDDAIEVLQRHPWQGNVRELENFLANLIALADRPVIDAVNLPISYSYSRFYDAARRKADGLQVALEAFERSFIAMTLDKTGWNRKEAARALGIGYSTLKKKLKKLDVVPPGDAPPEEPADEGDEDPAG